ncbi:hypothetical protein FQA39_LY01977 [Lamprigera yunnana]|nr:hypothetical protein FQA39_LY01977 [Lamprigera yunnana]
MFFAFAIKVISGYHKLSTRWDRSSTCLIGKTAIVTGANSVHKIVGIGFYTAQDFAKRGARVILACRDSHRAEEARKKIIYATDNDNVHVSLIDLSSFQSVRNFARRINTEEERLDILVNNAGALLVDNTTEDGLSRLVKVNYFGPFLLTHLLTDLLKKSKPSRIVNVSSFCVELAKLDIHNLNHFPTIFSSKLSLTNYSNTKLCNILFTNELARRLIGEVSVNSLDPGFVVTNILQNCTHKIYLYWYTYLYFLLRTSEEGAQTSIYVAVSKDLKNVTGKHFNNCHRSPMPAQAQDRKLALKLWELSESCVGLKEDEKIIWDKSPTCLIGKTAIVTGANCGIGFYTAQDFAKRGAKVILACRDECRAEEARKRIIHATDNINVHTRIVDFSSLQSVRNFANRINKEEERLDILVNNAGALLFNDETTEDGLNKLMQVNYFGPFLLTILLLGLLKKSKPSRIVNVSSRAAHFAKLDTQNLNYFCTNLLEKLTMFNYANTKLCNVLFTNELARRLQGSGVSANSLHPGVIVTNIGRNINFDLTFFTSRVLFLFKTAEHGAQTSIYVAVSKDIKNVTGEYFDDCSIGWMPSAARDKKLAIRVWEESERLVKLTKEEKVL